MGILLKEDLDALRCPGCGASPDKHEMYVHARCHPQAHLEVGYTNGILTLYCAECQGPVWAIAVAGG